MRKLIVILSVLSAAALLPGQQQFDITVRNVSVPVRVFDGDRFVDDLTLDDFEILEDGKPQKGMALYLTRKAEIERMEGRDYMPYSGRSFTFIFQLRDYHPRITEAMEYFFASIYVPDDQVVVMTPLKLYELSKEAVAGNPREKVVEYIRDTVRRDTVTAGQHYNSLMKDLLRDAQGVVGGDVVSALPMYGENLLKLDEITAIEEKRLTAFAAQLKRLDGQKNVFYFFQSEFRPKLSPMVLSGLLEQHQDSPGLYGQIQDAFTYYRKETNLDAERLTQAFSDSSILFNFLFINKRPDSVPGIQMKEQSEDVFEVFSRVADSTGGITDNSQNLAAAFERSALASQSYYLLYYSPEDYRKDGTFRNIEVRVKGRDFTIHHRLGYVAD